MSALVAVTEVKKRMLSDDSPVDMWIHTNSVWRKVNQNFLSVTIDTSSFKSGVIWNILHSPIIMRLAKYLSPGYLRIGGTDADRLVFERDGIKQYDTKATLDDLGLDCWEESENADNYYSLINASQLIMTGEEWLTIYAAAEAAGLTVLFDLNALTRLPDGNWNSTNARELLTFSKENNITAAWQLGNEPNHFKHKFGVEVPPEVLGKDYLALGRILVHSKFPVSALLVGPDVTNPKVNQPQEQPTHYLRDFLRVAWRALHAVTWHQYYFDGKTAQIEDFLNLLHFNALSKEIRNVKDTVPSIVRRSLPIWIGETSSAFGGGAPGLSDRFVASFLWLDKLGVAASEGVDVVVRQTLIGGNYGLIDASSLEPSPDWWVSLLFKRLVGNKVLRLFSTSPPELRLYAHCAAGTSRDVVLFGVNIGDQEVTINVQEVTTNVQEVTKNVQEEGNIQEKISRAIHMEKYLLTAPDNDLTSKYILLNGRVLRFLPDGSLPPLEPVTLSDHQLTDYCPKFEGWAITLQFLLLSLHASAKRFFRSQMRMNIKFRLKHGLAEGGFTFRIRRRCSGPLTKHLQPDVERCYSV